MFSWFRIAYWLTISVPLTVAVVTPGTLFPFIVGKYVLFRGLVDLAVIAAVLGVIFNPAESRDFLDRIKGFFNSPLGLAITVFSAVFVLAGFFGVDPSFSFWSNFERGEGGLQMLHLFTWLVLMVGFFRERSDWHKLFSVSVGAAILMCGYGLLAASGAAGFVGTNFSDPNFRFQGSIGNSAYVAAYLVFSVVWALLLIREKIKLNKILEPLGVGLILVSIIFVWVFFMTQTRGAFLGLVAAAVIGLAFSAFQIKKLRIWLLSVCGIALVLVGLLIGFQNSNFVQQLPIARVFKISFSEQNFETRLAIWQTAWESSKERPILGWGPENFIRAFDVGFRPSFFKPEVGFGAWYDRAHSIYFDSLATTGFLGLVSMLAMWLMFFWRVIRIDGLALGEKTLALAAAIAYLVQGAVLFDVLPIYLSYFALLAWIAGVSIKQSK